MPALAQPVSAVHHLMSDSTRVSLPGRRKAPGEDSPRGVQNALGLPVDPEVVEQGGFVDVQIPRTRTSHFSVCARESGVQPALIIASGTATACPARLSTTTFVATVARPSNLPTLANVVIAPVAPECLTRTAHPGRQHLDAGNLTPIFMQATMAIHPGMRGSRTMTRSPRARP